MDKIRPNSNPYSVLGDGPPATEFNTESEGSRNVINLYPKEQPWAYLKKQKEQLPDPSSSSAMARSTETVKTWDLGNSQENEYYLPSDLLSSGDWGSKDETKP